MLRDFQLSPESYFYQAFTLLWYHPSLKPGDLALLPTWRYFPDLDIAAFRQSWTDPDALATFFKCGNYGGVEINKYAESFTPVHYVNVAHDYPDAGDFLLAWRGHLFATNTGGKHTSGFNTILVNGKGQDGEGEGYTQPVPNMGQRAASSSASARPASAWRAARPAGSIRTSRNSPGPSSTWTMPIWSSWTTSRREAGGLRLALPRRRPMDRIGQTLVADRPGQGQGPPVPGCAPGS